MKSKKICLAGGHLSPAYAVASTIKVTNPETSIVFIGREKSFSSKEFESNSVEQTIMKDVVHAGYALPIERLSRSFFSWVSFVRSFILAIRLLRKERPSVVVSFGGYVGFIVGLAGWLIRIPLIIQEQTHSIGTANKMLSLFAKKILVSYPEMKSKTHVFAGFPIRNEVLNPPKEISLVFPRNKPILYITGGTTGAVSLNELFFPIIRELAETFMIVHQTGNVSFEKAKKITELLPIELRSSYYAVSYLTPVDASWLLHNAALIVGRSGANTVYELAVVKTPSILIPLPLSEHNEQKINAEWLQSYADTKILSQNSITSKQLMQVIDEVYTNKSEIGRFPVVSVDGTSQIANEIFSIL